VEVDTRAVGIDGNEVASRQLPRRHAGGGERECQRETRVYVHLDGVTPLAAFSLMSTVCLFR